LAADPGEAIANAIATFLTSESSGYVEEFTASAPDLPSVDRTGEGLAVQVVPLPAQHIKTTRGGKTLDTWPIHVIVTDNLVDGREQDSQIVNEIRQSLKGEAQAGYPQTGLATEVNFDVAQQRELSQFTAVIRAEYMGIS
jgi:hypothetical protein